MQAIGQGGAASGVMQVMAAAALWSTVGVASQLVPASGEVSDLALGVSRMAVGGPAILALVLMTRPGAVAAVLRIDRRQLVIFAAGCAVFQLCLFRAFTLLGVTETVFLTVCLPPLLACGWSLLRGREVLSRRAGLALALATAGLVVFAAGSGGAEADGSLGLGLVLALVASVAFVCMTTSARDMSRDSGPLVVAGAGLTLAGIILLVGLLVVDPAAMAWPSHDGWKMFALTLYLGLGPTALAYVVYCSGMARCRSASVGLIASMFEPGLAALLSWLLLSERLGPGEALGCAMVTAAMALLWLSERTRARS